jgi:hypothetical protein
MTDEMKVICVLFKISFLYRNETTAPLAAHCNICGILKAVSCVLWASRNVQFISFVFVQIEVQIGKCHFQ